MSTATKKKTTRTAAKKTNARRTRVKKVVHSPSDNEIRERAFQIYMNRGGQPGQDLQDWLEAENELKGSHAAA